MSNHLVRPDVRLARWIVGLLMICSAPLYADDAANWRVWMDAKFMRVPTAQAIPAAEKTVLVPGRLENGELTAFSKAEWEKLGVSWEEFLKRAQANAAAEVAALKPEYERDRKKVITYAMIKSAEPIVSGAVLSPKFLELFKDTLGPKVLVVVPNRFTAYVFPRLASNYRDYAPGVFADYRATAHPVSVEVFELSAAGLTAIGAYEEP